MTEEYSRKDVESAVLYVDTSMNEILWNLYAWKDSEFLATGEGPALTTLSSKRYPSGCLDMKVVFHYPHRTERSVWDCLKMSYAEYVKVKATTVLEFGNEGLEKMVVEGKDQRGDEDRAGG